MDVDSSESRNPVVATKSDFQSNGSNNATLPSKRPCANEDKSNPIEGNCGKADSITNEDSENKSLPKSDEASAESQSLKSDFSFREASSSAINDSNKQISDISTAIESNTVLAPEIKQEGSCESPDAPLPPYAVSKIQVSF